MKKFSLHLILGLLLWVTVALPVGASTLRENAPAVKAPELKLEPMWSYGEIRGQVVNCGSQNVMEGLLLHVPGMSIATRLGPKGEFLLHFVPVGKHSLMLENEDRVVATIEEVPVEDGKATNLTRLEVCLDLDGDGYNTLADLNDRDATVYPNAKDVCDSKDNDGDGQVDEDCSKAKCPKGGAFCLNKWNAMKRLQKSNEDVNGLAQKEQIPVFRVGEANRLIRVR